MRTTIGGSDQKTATMPPWPSWESGRLSTFRQMGRDREAQLVEAAGMTFHRIPMATRVAPTLAQIAQFMTIVTNPAHQPVYVHCAGGKHRTGVMTAVYRMEHDGWTAEQAYQEMKRYKFGSRIWHLQFKDFAYHYQPLRMYGSSAVRH